MRRRAKQVRRSRKAVLIAAGLFALTQLLLAFASETVFPELRDPSFGARHRLLIQTKKETPYREFVLALGSSRIETGLQPSAMNGLGAGQIVFNFGLTGGGPVHEWLAFRRLCEESFRPRMVLIEIMPALLFDPRPVEQCVHAGRLSWRDVEDLIPDTQELTPLVRDWFTARAVPIYSARFVVMSRLLPTWLPVASRTDYLWADLDHWGAGRLPESVNTAERRQAGAAQARNEYAHRLAHFEVSPRPAGYLLRLLNECQRRRIDTVLLLTPEDRQFQSLYSAEAMDRLDAFLGDVTRAFGVRLVDARDWLPDAAFYDGHHLLPAGANAFSVRLAVELRGTSNSGSE
jgi:hypothetical protein